MKPSARYALHLWRLLFALCWSTLSAALFGILLGALFATVDTPAAHLFRLAVFGVIAPILFFFTLRAAVVHDGLYAERYRQGTLPTGQHLCCMLRSGELWCDLAITLSSLLIAAPRHPLHAPIQAIGYATAAPSEQFYLFLLAVSFPLYAVLFLLAHLRARTSLASQSKRREQAITRKEARPPERPCAFLLACVTPSLILLLLTLLSPLAYSIGILLMRILGEVTVWITLGVLTAVLLTLRYTRAITKRRRFARDLRRVAEAAGDELVLHRPLWRSLFVGYDTPDFTLYHKGRRYDGMLVHALRKSTPMIFDGSGSVQVHRIVRLRRVELFRTVTVQRYAFESEGERVLIVLPTPKSLSFVGAGGVREVDVGDRIEGYAVFNATGFLRAVERDCLGRGEVLRRL